MILLSLFIRYSSINPLTKLTSGPPELPCCESTEQQKNILLLIVKVEQKPVKTDQMKCRTKKGTDCVCDANCGLTDINDGVSLDVVHVRVLKAQLQAVTVGGADNAGGDSVLQGERASYRHHKLTGAQV